MKRWNRRPVPSLAADDGLVHDFFASDDHTLGRQRPLPSARLHDAPDMRIAVLRQRALRVK